jgi:hypothetical protein
VRRFSQDSQAQLATRIEIRSLVEEIPVRL